MKMLDLSKFEKISEDKNTTTMKHKDGHEMTIMMAALPKIHREQLKRLKMAAGGVAHYDKGSPDSVSSDDAGDDQKDTADHGTTINIGTPGVNQPMAAQASAPLTPAARLAKPEAVENPQIPAVVNNLDKTGTMNPAAVAQNTQAANQGQANINIAKSKALTGLEGQYNAAAAQTAQTDQNNLNDVKGHVDALNQYIQENPIDPNHYAENMGTAKKVSTALGLLIGGFGGGFSGTGNNPAMNYLNAQIGRDIEAQKSRMDQQKTIYGAYHQLYGDSAAANAATKASMLDIYSHKANQIADQLGTPQAKVNAAALGANAALEKSKAFQDAVVDLRNLPGYHGPAQSNQTPGQMEQQNPQKAEPKQGQSQNQGYNESMGVRTYPVLAPGAVDASKGMTHLGYLDQGKLQRQLTSADQVDKVLNGPEKDGQGGIHQLMQDMYEDIGQGSQTGSLEQRMKGAIGHIPYVGDIGEKGANAIYSGEGYKDYSSKKTGMIQDLSTALQGLVAPTDIIKLVDDNLPIHGDSPADVENKEKQIANGIKKAMHTDELQKAGLLYQHKR